MLRLAASTPRRLFDTGSLTLLANGSAVPTGPLVLNASISSLLVTSPTIGANGTTTNHFPGVVLASQPTTYLTRSFASGGEPQRQNSPEDSAESRPSLTIPSEGAGQPSEVGQVQPTPSMQQSVQDKDYLLMHPVYTRDYLESVKPTHKPRETLRDRVGYAAVQVLRWSFDRASGYGPNMSERQWLRRILFLETIAGVPGMVAGMLRHMRSLRSMKRDHGWIHTLLEEAENERMHLLTFLQLRHPGFMFRSMVLLGQGGFFNAYMLAYIMWPQACHSFIGYLEEEAVRTYTHALQEIDSGKSSISHWATTPAPDIAVSYWRLEPGSTWRDLVLNVRADEAAHSYVNHKLSAIDKNGENPFSTGSVHVP